MSTSYAKMNSQGNDFIVIDTSSNDFVENNDNITRICSRKNVGCDQLLLIDTKNPSKVICKIYNSDGSVACQCGNGLRAIMLYLNKNFHISESVINVCDVDYRAEIIDKNKISVELGCPTFPEVATKNLNKDNFLDFEFIPVFVGNLHCVVSTEHDESDRDLIIEFLNSLYEGKANVTFILNAEAFKKDPTSHLKVKVKERGAGWTKSCGSGATASAAFMIKYGTDKLDLQPPINVEQEGGVLGVSWEPGQTSLRLMGPSEIEYEGTWDD